MDTLIYACDDCGMTFEEEANCTRCPDCNSKNIREATDEEYERFINQ